MYELMHTCACTDFLLLAMYTANHSMSNMKVLPELSPAAAASAAASVVDRSSGLPEPDEAMLHHEELHNPHKPQPVRRIQVEHLYLCILYFCRNTAVNFCT
jgi:hypothetical protein